MNLTNTKVALYYDLYSHLTHTEGAGRETGVHEVAG